MPTSTMMICHQTRVVRVPTIPGMLEMMLANRIMEIPLPIPNSVICSPSHMTRAEPAVNAKMMTSAGRRPSEVMMEI